MLYFNKYDMNSFRRFLTLMICLLSVNTISGQQTPYSPVSYRIFTPFIFNPAISGSKDFISIDLSAGWFGDSRSQVISGNTRLLRKGPQYFTSKEYKQFSNIGVGGFLFNETTDSYSNSGGAGTFSYSVPMNTTKLSFLSFGISVKGIFNKMDSVSSTDPALNMPSKSTFIPNLDAGIYYYGSNFFAGFSSTNLFGNLENSDSTGIQAIPVTRQYYLLAGYKFLVSKPLNLVIEPSFILNAEDTLSGKFTDMLKPMLKVYIQDFCFGTYFNDYSNVSFFFQYRYPLFYVGTYVEIPKNNPYYKSPLNIEFSLGINFTEIFTRNSRKNHW
jgi:type IX secretion system PorP/SprF family membrane protein